MNTLTTKSVFDGGHCTTLKADPKMVAMRDNETDEFVFQSFVGNGKGWQTIRPMTQEEIKEFLRSGNRH